MKFDLELCQRHAPPTKAQRTQVTERARSIFPFFRLPLELREQIYDESLQKYGGKVRKRGSLRYSGANMACMNLLLVSKQLKQEYECRTEKSRSLLVYDSFECRISAYVSVPKILSSSLRVTISILVSPDDVAKQELDMHRRWIEQCLWRMRKVLVIRIKIKVYSNALPELQKGLEDFVRQVYKASPVRLVPYVLGAECDLDHQTGMKRNFTPLMMWSNEKDKLEEVSRKC